MHIEALLRLQLKQDLFKELLSLYNYDLFKIDKKEYQKLCHHKIESKIESVQFMKQNPKLCLMKDKYRCCARIWDNHYGTRCTYFRHKDKDYCKHHLNVIQKKGKLAFNRYDEDRPIYNEKRNKIPWISLSSIEIVNQKIQGQWDNLSTQIHQDLKKQRQITPKI
tara:strand:+ start:305 stop:799 length:495 start_codon:yes stop_codon:yes gene_type:complete